MEYIILIISLFAIVWGAGNLVGGAENIARRFKISDFVIGAVIVGIGTSCPELVVSAYGALQGNVDVAIGNVVGSNIFNILCILGITALLHPVAVSKENRRFDLPVCIGVSILALLLAFNFFNGDSVSIGRIDGALFLLIFVAFIYVSFARQAQLKEERGGVSYTKREVAKINREGCCWSWCAGYGLPLLCGGGCCYRYKVGRKRGVYLHHAYRLRYIVARAGSITGGCTEEEYADCLG